MKLTDEEHGLVAFDVTDAAIDDLADTGALTIGEVADRELDDDDVDAIGDHISEIVLSLKQYLDSLEP